MKARELTITNEDLSRILSERFNNEWNGERRDVPLSEVLKKHHSPLRATDGFSIKQINEGENLQLANIGIIQLIAYLNNHIAITNNDFAELRSCCEAQKKDLYADISTPMYKVRINSEIFAYLLKTIVDKIIILLGLMDARQDIDSIGALLANRNIEKFCGGLFEPHKEFLDNINGLNNGYKHTFSNLQILNIVPQIEPVMFVLYKKANSTAKPTQLYHMLCSNAIDAFNAMLISATTYAKGKR